MKDKIKEILVDVYQMDGRYEDEAAERILRLFSVSRSANTDEYTKGYRDGWRDCCKDQKDFD